MGEGVRGGGGTCGEVEELGRKRKEEEGRGRGSRG